MIMSYLWTFYVRSTHWFIIGSLSPVHFFIFKRNQKNSWYFLLDSSSCHVAHEWRTTGLFKKPIFRLIGCIQGFLLDGCSFHYAHIWSKSGIFDVLKVCGYIERVVNSDIFRKSPILHITCATCSELPSLI